MPRTPNADSAPSVPASTGAKRKRLEAVARAVPRLRIPVPTRVRILELQEAGATEEETHTDLYRGGYLNAAGKAWGATFSDEVGKIRRVCRAAEALRDDRDTPLIDAVEDGNLAAVQTLLDAGADVEGRGEYGYTALIEASVYGHLAIVKALLAAGADVNASSYINHTSLMMASSRGHLDVVKALLAAGADVNARDHDGETALGRATEKDRAHVVRVLLEVDGVVVEPRQRGRILELLRKADDALMAKAMETAAA